MCQPRKPQQFTPEKNADRNLAALLSSRDPVIRLPSSGGDRPGGERGNGQFQGSYSPTFLRAEEKIRIAGLTTPINRTRPIAARTDAENGVRLEYVIDFLLL
jgi:hypothetical protein